MRVSVTRSGGFAGITRTTTADTNRLAPSDQQQLLALVRQAGLAGAAASQSQAAPQPDRFSYTVTVDDQGRKRSADFSEQSLPEEVRTLISWVGAVEGREESIGPPATP